MAKIGNLSEWIPKEYPENPLISSQNREKLINKYVNSQKSLELEIGKLKQELQEKNSKINQLATEHEPEKASLLNKISLLCGKLQAQSNEHFQVWIEEIELARIKARYNETTIHRLEGKLRNYKEKIIDLEGKLRILGVDPDEEVKSPADLNDFLKELFKITENLNFLAEKSVKNSRLIDSILGNKRGYEEIEMKRKEKNEKNLKKFGKNGTFEVITQKIGEALNMIDEINFFQNEISGNLNYLKDREIGDIYKTLRSSVDLVGNVKRTLEHCSIPIEERKGLWSKEQVSDKECKSFKDLHWTLQNLEKGMRDIVIKDDFKEVFELQDVLRKTIETVRASEESLIDMSRICNKDYQSLQNEKSLILQTKTTTALEDMNLIQKLLDLIQKQELQKQLILQPLKNQQETESGLIHLYTQKIVYEKNLLRLLNPSLDLEIFSLPSSTLESLLKSECSLLHNLESSLHSNNLKSLSEALHLVLKQVFSISSSLKSLQSFIAPVDESISVLISSLSSTLSSLTQTDPASLTSLVHSSTVQVSEVLNLFLTCLPQSSPSNSDLHSVHSLMQESNLTVDILIKFYKKGEIYRKMVENTEIPEFLIQKERNLADKWQLMLDYLARVAEIGTLLEQVKRRVLEDELDLGQVKTTWQKQGKNLLRSERAIKRLLEVAPDQELVQDLGSKLSGISKSRVNNLRSMRKNDSTGLTFQSNLDDLAESAEELNEVLEKLADSLAGKEDLNEGNGNHDEEIVEKINFRPLPIADDELVEELLSDISKNLKFLEELAAGSMVDEAGLENIIQEAAGLAGAAKLVKTQARHLRNLRDRIENFEENDRNKDKIIENIQSQQEKLINDIKMDMQKILDEKQKQQAQLDQLAEVHQKTLEKIKQKELETKSEASGLTDYNKKLQEALEKVNQEIIEKDQCLKKLEQEKSSESDRRNKEIKKISEDYENLNQVSALKLKELESKLKESELKMKEALEESKNQISPEIESVKSQLHQKFQQISDLELQIQNLKQALNSSSSELGFLTLENDKLKKIITELTTQLPKSQRKDSNDSKGSKESESSSKSSENPSELSSLKTYYSDILQNLLSKLSSILLKTDYVGDTLIEILPDSRTKTRMDNLQEQFEDIVNHKAGQNEPESELFELLDVLDRYETVNGEQAARLAGASNLNAGEDMEKLAKSGKSGLSMKNKKNLRSGRPPVAPQNSFKNSLEGVKKTLNEILSASNLQTVPDKDEGVEESTYYEIIEKRLSSFAQVYLKIMAVVREIEIEREKVVIEGIEVMGSKHDSEQVVKVLYEAYQKVKVKDEESIEVILAHSKVKIGIEKQVKHILTELLEKDSEKEDLEKIKQGLSFITKNSIETLKIFMNTEQINSVKSTAFEFELKPVSEMFDNFAARMAEYEKLKQDELTKLNNYEFWVNSLNSIRDLIGRYSNCTQELWTFYFRSFGKESDKLFIRTLTPTLPPVEKENSIQITSEIISIVSNLIQKNELKVKEISQKQEEFFNIVSENEETVDELIRKIMKDLQPGSDEKSKKELEILKTEFEGTDGKSYSSLYEMNSHIASALIQLGKFQNLLKKQGEDAKKQIKALKSNLVNKENDLNSLNSEFEQEKKNLKGRINLTESTLKDLKALNDKTNEDLVNKQEIISSLNNEKNDLNIKLDEMNNNNSQFFDQVEELNKKLKLKERNLKEKSLEVTTLEEKISELESRPAVASNPEEINDLKSELLRIKNQLMKSNNLIEQKEEDIKILKRDKILLILELNKVKENNKSLKEELGSIKAKIMICENNVRELEEKNRLGVERNEESITKIIMQVQELEKENEILKRQMKPALNYRRLYSGIVNENEINKSSAGHHKSKTRALKDKLNQNTELIEKLQHENRMMEKYKEEWLSMTQELKSLNKKLEILESPEVKNHEFSTAMTKMNEMMKEFIKTDILNEETKEKYLKSIHDKELALEIVRKKNVFFKILMIGRIRSYYRLAQWRSVTEIPEDVKYEDSDLVSLYTSIHAIILPSNCSSLSTPHLEKDLQSALINNPVKNQYKAFPIKCSSLPKFTLFKFFYSFLIEKAQTDKQNDSNCKPMPIPGAFLLHLRQQFGTAAESSHYLSEFIPALYYLYQEKVPLAVLICKLLKYQDPTPVSTYDDPIVLQVMLLVEKLTKFDDNFEGREEELVTLGKISRGQGFDIIQYLFGTNSIIGEVIIAQFDDSTNQNLTGADFLLNICEALVKVRSLRVDKVLERCQEENLDKEKFDNVMKAFKPDVDESHLEKYFLTAIKDSDVSLKASVIGVLEALDQAKIDFFSTSNSPKKEEVESIEKILSTQKSMISESEVAIHKKVIKKKVAKKNS